MDAMYEDREYQWAYRLWETGNILCFLALVGLFSCWLLGEILETTVAELIEAFTLPDMNT